MCCFSAKHVALRSKSKGWLALHKNNVSEWGGLSADCCFSKLALWKSHSACWSRTKRISSSYWKLTCSRIDIVKNWWVDDKQQSFIYSLNNKDPLPSPFIPTPNPNQPPLTIPFRFPSPTLSPNPNQSFPYPLSFPLTLTLLPNPSPYSYHFPLIVPSNTAFSP